jgi:hypothetical protein
LKIARYGVRSQCVELRWKKSKRAAELRGDTVDPAAQDDVLLP